MWQNSQSYKGNIIPYHGSSTHYVYMYIAYVCCVFFVSRVYLNAENTYQNSIKTDVNVKRHENDLRRVKIENFCRFVFELPTKRKEE